MANTFLSHNKFFPKRDPDAIPGLFHSLFINNPLLDGVHWLRKPTVVRSLQRYISTAAYIINVIKCDTTNKSRRLKVAFFELFYNVKEGRHIIGLLA